jgi:hypothetical protein
MKRRIATCDCRGRGVGSIAGCGGSPHYRVLHSDPPGAAACKNAGNVQGWDSQKEALYQLTVGEQ